MSSPNETTVNEAVATGQLDNNRRLQTVRRDIARIYTVMRERELAAMVGGA